jgi:hypothetical protein
MIAAARRRAMVARVRAEAFTKAADRRLNALLVAAPPKARATLAPWARWAGRRLRPVGVFGLRRLGWLERRLLRLAARSRREATRASGVLTPQRAICLTILASAGLLIAAQFVDYRAVEIGQPAYAGLPAASPPTVGAETAGEAHAYLLVPLGLIAGLLALAALRNARRRGVGRIVFVLGLLSLAVVLLVDLPAGADVGEQASRFSGAEAVLYDAFYAQVAAAAGLMLGGMLLVVAPKAAARYHARPCRTRINLLGRAASALRRRRRRRASSRGTGARRGSRRRKGAVSAPASPR